jgi:hypothetical protein
MKKWIFLVTVFLVSCGSTEQYNAKINKELQPKELRADVDKVYRNLTKYQADLHWYISEKDFKFKIDSLTNTLTKPMKPYDFFTQLAPVISEVKQGHLSVIPPRKRLTKAQIKALNNTGKGPFSQLELKWLNNKLFVTKNVSKDSSIVQGTQILALDGIPIENLYAKYTRLYSSDGDNKTFIGDRFGRVLSTFYTTEHGLKDSITYTFSFRDSVFTKVLIRESKKVEQKTDTKEAISKSKKKEVLKKKQKKNSYFGYNPATETFNREFSILKTDSTTAILKIRGFSIGNYHNFYKDAFVSLQQKKIKNLIIDLRDNPGGRLSEIVYLYAFLTKEPYVFCNPTEVTSRTSLLKADYFKGGNLFTKTLRFVTAPIYFTYTLLKVRKGTDGKFYYRAAEHRKRKPSPHAFSGNVYVLINGGSFSASCLLSSNLKGSKRATFIGQETGGAFNGTVAGRMPLVRLKNSEINVRIGLMRIAPTYLSDIEGRGIFPDFETQITENDLIANRDVEMEKAVELIKANNGK